MTNMDCMNTYIFQDSGIWEKDMNVVLKRVNRTFSDRLYRRNIERVRRLNWLEILK